MAENLYRTVELDLQAELPVAGLFDELVEHHRARTEIDQEKFASAYPYTYAEIQVQPVVETAGDRNLPLAAAASTKRSSSSDWRACEIQSAQTTFYVR